MSSPVTLAPSLRNPIAVFLFAAFVGSADAAPAPSQPGDADAARVRARGSPIARTLADRFADTVSVADFGAVGSGEDETAAIRAALAAGAGKRVLFPPPMVRYRVSGTLTVPSSTVVEGAGPGGVELEVPASADFPVLDVDGATRVTIRGFRLTVATGAPTRGIAYAVRVRGSAADVLVEGVEATGFVRGFDVAGEEGSSPGTARRITLRKCVAAASPSQFGFNADDVDLLLFDDCHAHDNWLDGFKLRKRTRNVTISGGSGNRNGIGFLTDTARYAGDGLDAYAGGDGFVVNGLVVQDNFGNGITIKTGELNLRSAEAYGRVQNAQLTNVRALGNQSTGLYLTASDRPDAIAPLVSGVTILGGVFEGNGVVEAREPGKPYAPGVVRMHAGGVYRCVTGGISAVGALPERRGAELVDGSVRWRYLSPALPGLYLNARAVAVTAPIVRGNAGPGIVVAGRALGVSITDALVVGNGTAAPGTFDGISIAGATGVTVRGGVFVGVDGPAVGKDADLAALSTTQLHAVRVAATSDEVEITGLQISHHSERRPGQVVRCDGPAGCTVHGRGPGDAAAYGAIGSTWTRTDATVPGDVLWVKASGAANEPWRGWTRVVLPSARAQADWDPPALARGACATLPLEVAGAAVGAECVVGVPPRLDPRLHASCQVVGASAAELHLCNGADISVDPPSGRYSARALNP
jgi:hypothetical protein